MKTTKDKSIKAPRGNPKDVKKGTPTAPLPGVSSERLRPDAAADYYGYSKI